jgi:hypothetical protein
MLTTMTHATRARMSLRPCKCVFGVPDRSELLVTWLGTNVSLRGVLMIALLKLRSKRYNARKARTTLPVRCQPTLLSYHFPTQKYTLQCSDLHHLTHYRAASGVGLSADLSTLRARFGRKSIIPLAKTLNNRLLEELKAVVLAASSEGGSMWVCICFVRSRNVAIPAQNPYLDMCS